MAAEHAHTGRLARALWIAAIAAALILRAYKAHAAGIVFDEAMSFLTFGEPGVALSSYEYPNNHVVNSVLTALAHDLFGGVWENAIRAFTLGASFVYVLAVAGGLRLLVRSSWLRLGGGLVLLFNAFLFDLSFLARGYALALGGFTLALYVLLRLARDGIPWRRRFSLYAFWVGFHFVVLGSMISAAPVVLALDLAAFIWLVPRLFEELPAGKHPRLSALLWVAPASATLLHALYYRLYEPILAWPRDFQLRPLARYLRQLFITPFGGRDDPLAAAGFALLVGLGLVLWLIARRRQPDARDQGDPAQGTPWRVPARRLLVPTLLITLGIWVVQRQVLGVSLGFPRNGVFILPVAWLLGMAALDQSWRRLSWRGPVGHLVTAGLLLGFGSVAVRNAPSSAAVNIARFELQSASAPLLRELRALDPERVWSVRLHEDSRYLSLSIEYYRRHGHRVTTTLDAKAEVDLEIWHAREAPSGLEGWRAERYDPFEVRIWMRPELRAAYASSD